MLSDSYLVGKAGCRVFVHDIGDDACKESALCLSSGIPFSCVPASPSQVRVPLDTPIDSELDFVRTPESISTTVIASLTILVT